ncbi:hypothetical protein HK096_006827, partial [Nowakowskiella sp. JEL0078]
MGKEFLRLSLHFLNEKESALDYICALILLMDFAFTVADVKNLEYICCLSSKFFQDHLMHVDPDNEVLEERKKWNLIEKESFRRAFWVLRDVIVRSDKFFTTTKEPLSDNAWNSLPNTFYKLPSSHEHLKSDPYDLKMDFICQHNKFLSRIQSIIFRAAKNDLENPDLHNEADVVYDELNQWGLRIDYIFPGCQFPISIDEWFGVYIHITFYSIILLNYRLSMVSFLAEQRKRKLTKVGIMNIVRNILQQVDSFQLDCQPELTVCLMQTCFFLGIVGSYGDADDIKSSTISDLGDTTLKMTLNMVNELEMIEKH